MVAMIYRRITPRAFGVAAVLLTVLLCVYYASVTGGVPPGGREGARPPGEVRGEAPAAPLPPRAAKLVSRPAKHGSICPKLGQSYADIDTVQVYKEFDFQVSKFFF